MGIYIGIIEKKGYTPSIFFNFKPIAEVQNSQVIMISPQEQEALLPESEKRNICFSYNWNDDDERRRMDEFFSESSLVLFEFTLPDLQPNFKRYRCKMNAHMTPTRTGLCWGSFEK
mgnify:CR=1 FL=1